MSAKTLLPRTARRLERAPHFFGEFGKVVQAVNAGRWIVKWRGFAVKFEPVACRKVYCLVADESATRFETAAEALATAATYNLQPPHVSVTGLP